MTIKKTRINGYSVELETGEDYSQCFIFGGKHHSASLELLSNYGILTGDSGHEDINVKPSTIDAIYDWAIENGY